MLSQDFENEILAINAIYPNSLNKLSDNGFEFRYKNLSLSFVVPSEYPSASCLIIREILFNNKVTRDQNLKNELIRIYEESGSCKQVILFEWIEFLINVIPEVEEVVEKKQECVFEVEKPVKTIFSSASPLIDRKSVFIAYLSKVENIKDVKMFVDYIKSIEKATHFIVAYRINAANKDCDDDGETAAGGRLLRMLDICNCEKVCVLVVRRYGGIKLGAIRFKHINSVARDLLILHGYIHQ